MCHRPVFLNYIPRVVNGKIDTKTYEIQTNEKKILLEMWEEKSEANWGSFVS